MKTAKTKRRKTDLGDLACRFVRLTTVEVPRILYNCYNDSRRDHAENQRSAFASASISAHRAPLGILLSPLNAGTGLIRFSLSTSAWVLFPVKTSSS